MDTKYLIFVIISALLVAAIYSSSLSIVFAAPEVSCNPAPNGQDVICTWRDKGKIVEFEYCYKDQNDKQVCISVPTESTQPIPESKLPDVLTDALSAATEETQNEPKVPKEPAFDNGLTTSPEEQNETEDPNEPAFNDGLTTSPGTR